jgi:hypothetical protein
MDGDNSHLTNQDLKQLQSAIKTEKKARKRNEEIAYIRTMVDRNGLCIDQDRDYVIDGLKQYRFTVPYTVYRSYPYNNDDMCGSPSGSVTGVLKFLADEFPCFDPRCPMTYQTDWFNETATCTQSCILWYKPGLNWNTDRIQIKMGLDLQREIEVIIVKIDTKLGYYYQSDPFESSASCMIFEDGQCKMRIGDDFPGVINYSDRSFYLETYDEDSSMHASKWDHIISIQWE